MNLKETFISTFEPVMLSKGFERKNKVFHRLVNEKIIQLLSYRSYGHFSFNIQFVIQPLCVGGECLRCVDDTTLSNAFGVSDWDDEIHGYKHQMYEAMASTETYLFPIFDLITDYQSYLDKFPKSGCFLYIGIPYEEDVRIVNHLLNNYDSFMKSKESNMKHWIEAKETYKKKHIDANQARWGVDYHIMPEYQKLFETVCNNYYCLKEAIIANNREFIESHIKGLENQLLDSYILSFYGKRKHSSYLETGELPFKALNL